jgi:hypothetical protein
MIDRIWSVGRTQDHIGQKRSVGFRVCEHEVSRIAVASLRAGRRRSRRDQRRQRMAATAAGAGARNMASMGNGLPGEAGDFQVACAVHHDIIAAASVGRSGRAQAGQSDQNNSGRGGERTPARQKDHGLWCLDKESTSGPNVGKRNADTCVPPCRIPPTCAQDQLAMGLGLQVDFTVG